MFNMIVSKSGEIFKDVIRMMIFTSIKNAKISTKQLSNTKSNRSVFKFKGNENKCSTKTNLMKFNFKMNEKIISTETNMIAFKFKENEKKVARKQI